MAAFACAFDARRDASEACLRRAPAELPPPGLDAEVLIVGHVVIVTDVVGPGGGGGCRACRACRAMPFALQAYRTAVVHTKNAGG